MPAERFGGGDLQNEAGILFEDGLFLIGIEVYECKSLGEDPGIIEVLREKNANRLFEYIKKRIEQQYQ